MCPMSINHSRFMIRTTLKRIFMSLLLTIGVGVSAGAQTWLTFNVKNSEIGGNTILALATDKKNNKWVGTNLGLCRYSGKTWMDYSMFNEKLKDQFVNCLTVDSKGTLWIGTDDYGVIEFNGSKWTEYTQQTKQMNMKFIREITIDRNDVKWIGVTLGGLVKYDGTDWTKYTASNSGLLSDFILCVTIDQRNNKWIGTNDGLCVFDNNKWTSYTTKNSGLPHNIVPSVVVDKNNVKWIGTLSGLCRFDGENWTIYNKLNSPLPSNQINDLCFDAAGMLWIATDEGVAVFDCQKNWRVFTPKNSPLPGKVVQNIAIDGQGIKWFGTDFHGLVRFTGQGIQGRIADEKGVARAGVTVSCGDKSTVTDENGIYYLEVATGTGGVLRPQLEGFTFVPEQADLTNVTSFTFNKDFVISSGMVASGNSAEKVMVNPFLADGYITITMESPVAEVEFVDQDGNSIRTIPAYKNGARITISKMPKAKYTLYIRTAKGEKSLKFNLK